MAVTEHPQTAVDERDLANDDLEKALEQRQKARDAAAALAKTAREKDAAAKSMLAEFQLADGEIARCGRFRIVNKKVSGRVVSFETAPTTRLTIRLADGYGGE
jgi:hypothetical protein